MNCVLLCVAHLQQCQVITGNTEQTQTNDEHARDGAAAKRDVKCRIDALGSSLSGANVGAYRDVHAYIARERGKNSANSESNSGRPTNNRCQTEDQEQYDTNSADRHVLTIHIGIRAFLNSCLDLLHPAAASRLLNNPLCGKKSKQYCECGCTDREPKGHLVSHQIVS